MPTTTLVDTDIDIRSIAARTDFAGSGETDVSAEEDRYPHILFSDGVVKPTDAFEVVAGGAATMNVVVGSGDAKADYAMVAGVNAGQGNYLVRNNLATKTITLSAADPTNPRIDEVYLIVQDNAYDASSRALPSLAVREGDPAASPVAPGTDAAWDAYLLLASVDIPAAAADILAATITDERVNSQIDMADGIPAATPQQINIDEETSAEGSATTFARSDHRHGLPGNLLSEFLLITGGQDDTALSLSTSYQVLASDSILTIPSNWQAFNVYVMSTATFSHTGLGTGTVIHLEMDVTCDSQTQTETWDAGMNAVLSGGTGDASTFPISTFKVFAAKTGTLTVDLKARFSASGSPEGTYQRSSTMIIAKRTS